MQDAPRHLRRMPEERALPSPFETQVRRRFGAVLGLSLRRRLRRQKEVLRRNVLPSLSGRRRPLSKYEAQYTTKVQRFSILIFAGVVHCWSDECSIFGFGFEGDKRCGYYVGQVNFDRKPHGRGQIFLPENEDICQWYHGCPLRCEWRKFNSL